MPFLKRFTISDNELQDIAIKDCPSLEQLHISLNNLTKLQIIDFPALV